MSELKEGTGYKKQKTPYGILIGLGISAAAYFIIWLTLFLSLPNLAIVGITILVVAVLGFIIVKFYRLKRMAAANTMLVLITPLLFFMLLFGACGLMGPMF